MREGQDEPLLPPWVAVINGPEEFEPGPDGQCLEVIARELAGQLASARWFVIRDKEGPVVLEEPLFLARLGFNPQERKELYLCGGLKPGGTLDLQGEVIPEGRSTEYGRLVWTWHVQGQGDRWDVDVFHDEQGFFWRVRQELGRERADLQARHKTRMQALRAAVEYLRENGAQGLLPIMLQS